MSLLLVKVEDLSCCLEVIDSSGPKKIIYMYFAFHLEPYAIFLLRLLLPIKLDSEFRESLL